MSDEKNPAEMQEWKETAERHENYRKDARFGLPGFDDYMQSLDPAYNPSFITGRCLCKACKAARDHSQKEKNDKFQERYGSSGSANS